MLTIISSIIPAAFARLYRGLCILFCMAATIHCAHAQTCPAGNVVYVDANASGSTPDGTSWSNAFNSLQDALVLAGSCTHITQIWVAKGTYYPDEGGGQTDNDINATFRLKSHLAIYGGFNGKEADLSDRNWKTNATILSGDLNKDNKNNPDDAASITTGSGTDNTAVLDGFTISGAASHVFYGGGGMFNTSGSPTINNCIFSGNISAGDGGGMYNDNSSPAISNCVFYGNAAGQGGGIYNNYYSKPVLTNCTFSGNSADDAGGGVCNDDHSVPVITNCIFWNNKDNSGTGTASASLSYASDAPTVTYSLIQNYSKTDGSGNLDGITYAANANYPLFASKGDFRLQCFSPAIDKGNTGGAASTDLSVNPRVVNDVIDLGAYENQGDCTPFVTTTAINSSFNPSCFGSQVKFTSTVLINGNSSTPAAAGWVTFTQGAAVLADSVAVDAAGQASFSTDTLDTGSHSVVATYIPPTGFTGSSNSVTQVINARPAAAISGNATYCSGANTATKLTFTVTGSAPVSGSLSDGTLFGGTPPTIDIYRAPVATTTYTITGLSGGNCTARSSDLSGSAIVTINPRPTAAISGGATFCSGSNTATKLTLAVTNNGAVSGSLSDGTLFGGPPPTINIYRAPAATTTYTITSLSGGNCPARPSDLSGSATVTVKQGPRVAPITYAGNTAVCSGSVVSLTDATAGGVWRTSGVAAAVSSSGKVTFATVKTTTAVTVYYTVSGNGCSSQASVAFTVNPPITVKPITGNTNICGINSTSQLSNATSGGAWSSSNTSVAAVSNTGKITGKSAGSATVYYSVSSGGCTSSAQAAVSVRASPAVAGITGENAVTKGFFLTLKDATKDGVWSSSNTAIATVNATGKVKGITAGTCAIYYTVTSGVCSATAIKSINVYNPITATITTGKILCHGNTTTLTVQASGGSGRYRYSLNNGNFQAGNTFTVRGGQYSIEIRDQQLAQQEKPQIFNGSITEPLPLIFSIENLQNASSKTAADGSFKVVIKGGRPGYRYSKNGGASYQESNTFRKLVPGIYEVSVKDANNCVSLNTLKVTVGYGKKRSVAYADEPLSVSDETDTKIDATVFPNPSMNSFNLKLTAVKDEMAEVRVMDVLGREVYHTKGNATGSYNFGEHFTPGMYLVEIMYKEAITTLKIIKL